jgi:uncharacterized protein YggE
VRLAVIGLSLALSASVPLAAAVQGPVGTPPLQRGEVLAEMSAIGMVTTRADRATLTFTVSASGVDEAAARAGIEGTIRELRGALRGLGVAEADIAMQPLVIGAGDPAGTMADMMDTNAMVADADVNMTAGVPEISAGAETMVTIRDLNRVEAIQGALIQRGIFAVGGASYVLNDDSGPRREARVRALAKARADAETYAAALNMRVVRVVRVTERLGMELFSMAVSESQILPRMFSPAMMRTQGPDIPTLVVVGVDFALAPR